MARRQEPEPRVIDRGELLRRTAIGAAAFAGPWWRLPAASAAPSPVQQLAAQLKGPVIARTSSAYDEARTIHNARYAGVRPLAVAYPLGTGDVARALAWARKHGVRVALRSGGHSYGGWSTVANGLVLDVGRLKAIGVSGRSATVGAGALLGDVYATLGARNLVVPGGSCPTVGITGLTLGGGHGFYSRKHGLTCDNVLEVELVTAAGDRRVCNARQNADLLWACRGGGGGSFGVVTRWKFRAHPVGAVSTFRVTWPWSQAQAALAAWQSFAPSAPDGLFSVFRFSGANGGGDPVVACSGQLLGPESQLRSLVAPLENAGTPLSVSVVARANLEAVRYWGGDPADVVPVPFAAKSDYARKPLSATAVSTIMRAIEQRVASVPGSGALLLDSYGGAINRVPRAATAFSHRDALFSFQYLAYWGAAAYAARNVQWLRDFHKAMRPHVSGEAYVNYADPDLADYGRAYWGANLARLRSIKKKYDPSGVFRFPQSIH